MGQSRDERAREAEEKGEAAAKAAEGRAEGDGAERAERIRTQAADIANRIRRGDS